MDIEKIRTFLTAARSESFSQAAEELFITTSTVSKHIAALETELGTELFRRTPRQAILTDSGRDCLESARRIVEEYDALLEKTRGGARLDVLCIPNQFLVMPCMEAFRQACPSVSVELRERHGLAILKAMENGEAELAFVGSLYCRGDSLEQYLFNMTRLGVVLSREHPLAERETVSLRELKNEKFFLMAPETGLYQVYVDLCRKAGFSPRVVSSKTREDVLVMLAASEGVSLFSEGEIDAFSGWENVRFVPLEEEYDSGIAMIRRKDRRLSPAAAKLWDFVIRYTA
ncbi:MAG: LysR family transcriptional regulator [Oscillospiraceae bacterium]